MVLIILLVLGVFALPVFARGTAALAGELLRRDIRIGLNVRADNAPARASCKKNGFEAVAEFSECIISRA
jgi:predicted GNAT family acetyltransferase